MGLNEVEIKPCRLSGDVTVPYSKSELHRVVICSALATGKKFLDVTYKNSFSDDVITTIDAMDCLLQNKTVINCRESASTLRFLIPLVGALDKNIEFVLGQSLSRRPIEIYIDSLVDAGMKIIKNNNTVKVSGKLKPGVFVVRADVSSQFISGLMFALPLLNSESRIILSTSLESGPYVDMTIHVLRKFGVTIDKIPDGWKIPGSQNYIYTKYNLERDWSQAAFFLSASAIGNNVFVEDMDLDSIQGDKYILDILESFGARKIVHENKISFLPCELISAEINIVNTPDLAPIVSVVAALAKGETRIYGVKRLKFKECDRLCAIIDCLERLGVNVHEKNDSLSISGKKNFNGTRLSGFSDHRIVMAMSIAATRCVGRLSITDAGCVSKSYKNFFSDYKNLGGNFNVIDDWKTC